MYGAGVKTLTLHRDRCVIDLHPFFKEMFETRDSVDYGVDKPKGYRRWEQEGDNIIKYRFTMPDFLGACISRYPRDEIADFLELHLIDDVMSESLVRQIRDVFNNYNVIFTGYCSDGIRYFCSHRLSRNDLDMFIPKKFWSVRHRERYTSMPAHPDLGKLNSSHGFMFHHQRRVIANILAAHPDSIIVRGLHRGPDLFADKGRKRPDYLGMWRYYDMSSEGYELVRIG